MKKIIFLSVFAIIATSCASKKEFEALQAKYNRAAKELVNTKASLQKCLIDKTTGATNVSGLEGKVELLENQVKDLKADKAQAVKQVENLTVLTQSASDNIKNVVSQLSEKDKYINGVRDAMSRKDSINLALAFHLKKELDAGIQDHDIQINVEKTVVYISIADKLLFNSGSAVVSQRAKEVLGKVAKVVATKPEMEVQVEGYTDNVPISNSCIKDNWDLSVKRATAVVRVLQNDFSIDPGRLIAAGRSEYVPIESNDTVDGRATNRRTRIVILPKLEQFFEILEQKPE
ncbi:flagellar motor protein MotB [Tenacibaculum sp. UWU-22]|uniref:OmpA/MotB family protein n=1 Tax=Tenacibaculum sp. UWU-22 TaxID=3234187 RepID=UPI0034DAD614